MSREWAVAVMIAAGVLLLLLMLWGWRRRLRRDAGQVAPLEVPANAVVRSRYPVLYVATTRHEDPLERVAIRPLAYRARGEVCVTDLGIALELAGSPTVFLDRDRLEGAGQATWTIDRVVEEGGLARIGWRSDSGEILDSYLRLTSGDPQPLLADITDLCTPSETGATT